MKKISEFLPEKKKELYNHIIPIKENIGWNYYREKATKALDAIDPTKIRYKAKRVGNGDEVLGFYCYDEVVGHQIINNIEGWVIDPSTLTVLVEE